MNEHRPSSPIQHDTKREHEPLLKRLGRKNIELWGALGMLILKWYGFREEEAEEAAAPSEEQARSKSEGDKA